MYCRPRCQAVTWARCRRCILIFPAARASLITAGRTLPQTGAAKSRQSTPGQAGSASTLDSIVRQLLWQKRRQWLMCNLSTSLISYLNSTTTTTTSSHCSRYSIINNLYLHSVVCLPYFLMMIINEGNISRCHSSQLAEFYSGVSLLFYERNIT